MGIRTMDPEVVDLCKALNDITPSLRTFSSCSGHGKHPLFVGLEFQKDDTRGLTFLTRVCDRRYSDPWDVTLSISDSHGPTWSPVMVSLHSGVWKGEEAYDMAERLIKNIDVHRRHDSFLEAFGLLELKIRPTGYYWAQGWLESELGEGCRFEGYTLHTRRGDIGAFLKAMRVKEAEENPGGVTPCCYNVSHGDPFLIVVEDDAELVAAVRSSDCGIWAPNRISPEKLKL